MPEVGNGHSNVNNVLSSRMLGPVTAAALYTRWAVLSWKAAHCHIV